MCFFLLVRLEFSARCSHLMTTKVATCFWLNVHLVCALYGLSVCVNVCVRRWHFVSSLCVCVSQTWLELLSVLPEPPAPLLSPSVLLIVLAGCPEGISTFPVRSRLNLSIYSLHFSPSQVQRQYKCAVWKASEGQSELQGCSIMFGNVITAWSQEFGTIRAQTHTIWAIWYSVQ